MKLFIPVITLLIFLSSIVKSQNYIEGQVITLNKDTVNYKILKYKNRKQEVLERYNAIQIQTDSGQVKTLYAKDISGYIKEGVFYKSLYTNTKEIPQSGVFIEQITGGRAELYFHPGHNIGGEKYFFKRSGQKEFIVWGGEIISKVEEADNLGRTTESMNQPEIPANTYWKITQNVDKYRAYFTKYFADCPLIVNKLKSEFYEDGDIKSIFKDYYEEGKRLDKKISQSNR